MLLFVALLAFFLGVYPQPLLELVQHAGLVAVAP
jgi:NADH-quinone oxidoreductase subunit N